ncbi:WD domain-containing protein [Thozetella sp. PMI_491]|nr:WD domain-containing protein [Thozetella sp. PMI_491]
MILTMSEGSVHVDYLSAGANRHAGIVDWSEDGQVAFGAHENLCIWNPEDARPRGISKIFKGHGDIRAVRFLPRTSDDEPSYIATGGDDGCLRIWALNPGEDGLSYVQADLEHTGAINCIDVCRMPIEGTSRVAVVSGGSDATLRIWLHDAGRLTLLQTITTKQKYYPMAVAISAINGNEDAFVLAVAGTSSLIQLYVAQLTGGGSPEFQLQATLPGHENWIRSLEFVQEKPGQEGDLLLASASQDKYIRLWRVHQGTALSALNLDAMSSMGALLPGNKLHKMKAGGKDYCVIFEALLLGHEDWVYSAKWSRTAAGKLQLLSASADNSLSIWEADPDSGIWVTTARLGEVSRDKGATTATGSVGGFWTGVWSPSGASVLTLTRMGSFRRWEFDEAQDQWIQQIAISGHIQAVTGISWSCNGSYLLSTSTDQTTRLHAQWKAKGTWHEMSRAQIHGYDLNCIDSLGNASFVSGADEKLMRVFTEPKAVAKMLYRLTETGLVDDSALESRPDAATIPVLGLSNKAVDMIDDDADLEATAAQQGAEQNDRDAQDPASFVRKSALEIDHPPLEDTLSRHTLWPEIEKLYGHGYEISCLASSHDGRLVASACKASSVNHAVIRLFETENWTEVKPPIAIHSLTAARIRFSPDDKYILSVGRDRQWAVCERTEGNVYTLLQASKGHSRMILDAAWAPSTEKRLFATAGRDKQLKLWIQKGGAKVSFVLAQTIPYDTGVSALDFLSTPSADGHLLLAAGTEAGKISMFTLRVDGEEVTVVSTVTVEPELCLPREVLQLAWRPRGQEETKTTNQLAIAGADGTFRVYSFPR